MTSAIAVPEPRLAGEPLARAQAELAERGFVILRQALAPARVALLQEVFARFTRDAVAAAGPHAPMVELKRTLEYDPAFADLMDLPSTFPLVRAAIGADITLATAGEAYEKPPRTPAAGSWHADFQWLPDLPRPLSIHWLRCTFLIDDIDEDTSPMAMIPGSHRHARPVPPEITGADGQPLPVEGMITCTGRAGDCVVNNTEIWHTNTPNRGDRPRRIVMLLYKHAWMRPWEDGYEVSAAFAAAQTDPLRRQLCGIGLWHATPAGLPVWAA